MGEGRLARITGGGSGGVVDLAYEYDPAGRLIAARTPEGVASFTYHPNGSRATQTLPNGVETAYAYDNLLRTKAIAHRDPQDATAASFVYEVGRTGRRLGVAEEIGGVTAAWEYEYDGLGRLYDAKRSVFTGETAYRYRYNEVGNRLAKGVDDVTTTYA